MDGMWWCGGVSVGVRRRRDRVEVGIGSLGVCNVGFIF